MDAKKEEIEIDINGIFLILKKHIKFLVGLTILFIVISGGLYFTKKKKYKTNFIITSQNTAINYPEVERLIKDFGYFYSESPEYILISPIVEEKKSPFKIAKLKIESGGNNSVNITMQIKDTSYIKKIPTALISYLNNNSYIKQRVMSERQRLEQTKAELVEELGEMQETKKMLFRTSPSNNYIVSYDIHQSIVNLEEKILNIDYQLIYTHGFVVAVHPFIPLTPEGLSLIGWLAAGGFTGCIAGALWILFKNRNFIKTI